MGVFACRNVIILFLNISLPRLRSIYAVIVLGLMSSFRHEIEIIEFKLHALEKNVTFISISQQQVRRLTYNIMAFSIL